MADRAQTTPSLPGQVVLVFQGGGALGAYQGGVYQALHEAGIEPNWVIGTSIGAINGAIIAGKSFQVLGSHGAKANLGTGTACADRWQCCRSNDDDFRRYRWIFHAKS